MVKSPYSSHSKPQKGCVHKRARRRTYAHIQTHPPTHTNLARATCRSYRRSLLKPKLHLCMDMGVRVHHCTPSNIYRCRRMGLDHTLARVDYAYRCSTTLCVRAMGYSLGPPAGNPTEAGWAAPLDAPRSKLTTVARQSNNRVANRGLGTDAALRG